MASQRIKGRHLCWPPWSVAGPAGSAVPVQRSLYVRWPTARGAFWEPSMHAGRAHLLWQQCSAAPRMCMHRSRSPDPGTSRPPETACMVHFSAILQELTGMCKHHFPLPAPSWWGLLQPVAAALVAGRVPACDCHNIAHRLAVRNAGAKDTRNMCQTQKPPEQPHVQQLESCVEYLRQHALPLTGITQSRALPQSRQHRLLSRFGRWQCLQHKQHADGGLGICMRQEGQAVLLSSPCQAGQ